jgi:hypothetical protein
VFLHNRSILRLKLGQINMQTALDGIGWQTAVTSSADAPLEALDKENMIAVGTWGTLTPLRPYLDRMSFELGAHETYVKLRHPAPGEPQRIENIVESPERTVWPGVYRATSRKQRSHTLINSRIASYVCAGLISD